MTPSIGHRALTATSNLLTRPRILAGIREKYTQMRENAMKRAAVLAEDKEIAAMLKDQGLLPGMPHFNQTVANMRLWRQGQRETRAAALQARVIWLVQNGTPSQVEEAEAAAAAADEEVSLLRRVEAPRDEAEWTARLLLRVEALRVEEEEEVQLMRQRRAKEAQMTLEKKLTNELEELKKGISKNSLDATPATYKYEIMTDKDVKELTTNEEEYNILIEENVVNVRMKTDIIDQKTRKKQIVNFECSLPFLLRYVLTQFAKNVNIVTFEHPVKLPSLTWGDVSKMINLFEKPGNSKWEGGAKAKKLIKTETKIVVKGKTRVLYLTPRGKQYVRMNGGYVAVKDLVPKKK